MADKETSKETSKEGRNGGVSMPLGVAAQHKASEAEADDTAIVPRREAPSAPMTRAADAMRAIVDETPHFTKDEIKALHARAAQKTLAAIYREGAITRGYLPRPK